MKTTSYITFVDMQDLSLDAFKIIGKEKQFDTSDKLQAIELDTSLQEYTIFLEMLRKFNIDFDEQITNSFSSGELKKSEFLHLVHGEYAGYPKPEDNFRNQSFDIATACPVCGNGSKQNRPFMIDVSILDSINSEIFQLHWVYEYIISDRLADLFKELGFSGCEIWPVLDSKSGNEISGWKQLFICNELLPMSEETNFPIVPEPTDPLITEGHAGHNFSTCDCGKLGRNKPVYFVYEKSNIDDICDFNLSYEWLGGGDTTYQQIIVSNKVFKFFSEQNIQNLTFEPVLIK